MDRKDFFKKGLQSILKTVDETKKIVSDVPILIKDSFVEKVKPEEEKSAFRTIPEFTKAKQVKKNLKLPPGAILPIEKFKSKCTSCGDCITSCPYGTIFPIQDAKSNRVFPYLDPNLNACQMCVDTPCIKSCSTGALKPIKKNQNINLGKAKILFNNCINFFNDELTCTSCKTSCPIENVIKFKSNRPTISKDCTGCGICVQSCPTFPKAIIVK